jgi:hypothetical protein
VENFFHSENVSATSDDSGVVDEATTKPVAGHLNISFLQEEVLDDDDEAEDQPEINQEEPLPQQTLKDAGGDAIKGTSEKQGTQKQKTKPVKKDATGSDGNTRESTPGEGEAKKKKHRRKPKSAQNVSSANANANASRSPAKQHVQSVK